MRKKTKNKRLSVFSQFFLVLLILGTGACTERRQENLLREGDQRILEARYVKAVELYRKALSMDPESPAGIKAAYKLGFSLETYFKDFKGALLSYEEFVKHSTDPIRNYGVIRRMGSIQLDHVRDFEGALISYNKLLDQDPSGAEAPEFIFRKGRTLLQLNRFEEARKQYQILLDRFPDSQLVPRARYEVGNTYYMQERYDVAAQALKQVLRKHSQSKYAVEAQFLMARCFEQQLKFASALEMYEGLQGRYSPKQVLAQRIEKVKRKVRKP